MRIGLRLLILTLLLAATQNALCGNEPPGQLADRVANWQLAHRESLDGIRTFRERSLEQRGWIQAAFYIGLERWSRVTDNTESQARFRSELRALAEQNEWRLGDRIWHADDQAIAQVYLALEDANIGPVKEAFDQVLALNAQNSLEFVEPKGTDSEGGCQQRWCWCDALFMAPPAWAALSRVSGDPRYLDYAVKEFIASQDYLFDPEEKLFYRDSRFFDRQTEFGNKVFWGRGNGWVFAGLPLFLEQMPEDHPEHGRFLQSFMEMAETFRNIQTDQGLWAPSLLDFEHDPMPETSGSGFIVFGLAWGVNRGYLSREEYLPVIRQAWQAIAAAVTEEGMLGWVQQVGNAPEEVFESDSQFYGSGALLLAASELVNLEH